MQNQTQRLVDTYFESKAIFWKDIYQGQGVFETIHQQRRSIVLDLVDKLTLPPESRILEIGCGGGSTSVAIAQRGYFVDAVDSVPAMVDLARQLAIESGVERRLKTDVGNVHDLAYPENTFSLVLAIGVIPWLQSMEQPIQELTRVLKPGGYLIVNADNRLRLAQLLDPVGWLRTRVGNVLRRFGLRKPEPHVQMCSMKQFDLCLSRAGLKIVTGMTLGFGPFSICNFKLFPDSLGVKVHNKLQSLADRGIAPIRATGAQYIVLARK